MSKITIIEGNSNDKDQTRIFMVKGEKGDKGDTGPRGQDGANSKTSELENDSGFITIEDVQAEGYAKDSDVTTAIETAITQVKLAMFPVGSVYFTVDNTNPSTFIGGTWTRIAEGLFIAGVGTGTDKNNVEKQFVAGENDGEFEHIQTLSEMAQHNHTITDNGHTHNYGLGSGGSYTSVIGGATATNTQNRGTTDSRTTGITINDRGSSQAMNITNPSFGLYVWQRTA